MIETFIAFSGGIDSTYNLWRWLRDHPEQTILIHHVAYYNGEKRTLYEQKAVHQVLKWLNDQGMTNYKYVESILDLTQFKRYGLDTITLASLHGTLLTAYWDVKYWIANTPRDEYIRIGDAVTRRRERADDIIKLITNKRYQRIYSLHKLTKKQIIEDMPPELFKLTWYCRRPTKEGMVCGECHTCKQVEEALK